MTSTSATAPKTVHHQVITISRRSWPSSGPAYPHKLPPPQHFGTLIPKSAPSLLPDFQHPRPHNLPSLRAPCPHLRTHPHACFARFARPAVLQEELEELKPGQRVTRIPPRPRSDAGSEADEVQDPFKGTWEVLMIDTDGRPLLDRHDVWGWIPTAGARPADNLKGFNFIKSPNQQQ
eukprot:353919-Chlamydomonas_euryale.AAC.11